MYLDDPYELPDPKPRADRRLGSPIDPLRLLGTLRRGKWWLLSALVAGVALSIVASDSLIAPAYRAGGTLRYDGFQVPGRPEVFDVRREMPATMPVLFSDPTIAQLREEVGLGDEKLREVRERIEIVPQPEAGLITINAIGQTPEQAAELSRTLGDLFRQHHRTHNQRELVREIENLDERIETTRANLDESRAAYDRFRQDQGITDLSTEQEQAIAGAADLLSRADLAEAEVSALEARVGELRRGVRSGPRTSRATSETTSEEARRLAETRVRLTEARSRYSADHPTVQALERQEQSLSRRVAASERRMRARGSRSGGVRSSTVAGARADLEAARHRAENLRRMAEESRQRINRLSAIEGEASGLLAEVQVNQTILTDLREERARLVDARQHVTSGFGWITPPEPPESAMPSKRRMLMLAAIPVVLVGLVLTVLLLVEVRGLRVATPKEAAYWASAPVIAASTWPNDHEALFSLVADLDDSAPKSEGTVLVVGATEEEQPLAAAIASELNLDWNPTHLLEPPGEVGVTDGEVVPDPSNPSGRPAPRGPGTALARYETLTLSSPSPVAPPGRLVCHPWSGPPKGQSLRRAARLVDRVLVVARSKKTKASQLASVKRRLGRDEGVGLVVVGVNDELADLDDRVGSTDEFWTRPAA